LETIKKERLMIDKPAGGGKLPLVKLKQIKMKKTILIMTMVLLAAVNFSQAQKTGFNSRYRVAVMPLVYMGDGSEGREEEMRYQLQDVVVSYMSRSAAELKFVDAAEINAILYKKGIDQDNIRQYTPAELADLLHVEYVIMGSVIQDPGNIVTTENRYNVHRQYSNRRGRYDDRRRITGRSFQTGNTVTRQHIKTQVSVSIYNETGERIYSQSRQSILTETNAYRNALHYLLKRTPIYNR
jgi:hypothetical protein